MSSVENISLWIVSVCFAYKFLHESRLSCTWRHRDDEILYLSGEYLSEVFCNQFMMWSNLKRAIAIDRIS